MARTATRQSRHKCRRPYCPNRYDDTIGDWGGQLSGAECIPCLYAIQIVSQGMTVEQVEETPHLLEQFNRLLEMTGWTWQHVKDSYSRINMLPPDAREVELVM